MNSEKSETNESDKFSYHFTDITDKLNVKHPNKNISLVNLGIYYAWKNIKFAYNNNKLNISAPAWNVAFDLSDGSHSVSDIQDYFEYII